MTDVVELRGVSYRYPNAQDWSLRQIDLTVERGKFVAIMGPNGSGKTTLSLCLNGLIPQLLEGEIRGQIVVAGLKTANFRVQTLARHVGMVLQDPEAQLFGQTVWDDAAFGPCNFAYPLAEIASRVQTALKSVRLNGFDQRNTTQLSGGEKQRLALAGVLAEEPEILVLDEPAAELDPRGRQEVYAVLDLLRTEKKLTVIVVEHSPHEVLARADEVVVLNCGQIAWRGAPGNLFGDPALVQQLGLRPAVAFAQPQGNSGKHTASAYSSGSWLSSPGGETGKQPVIALKGVTYAYLPSCPVLQGVSLTIYPGEFVALVGSNGAGKTTLARHLNGLLKPMQGDVVVSGMNTREHTVNQLAGTVGYLFQNPDHQIFAASIEEELAFGLRNIGLVKAEIAERIDAALHFTGLAAVRRSHPFILNRGDRQLLAFAAIAARRPAVLVIDEPSTGLDWAGVQKLMAMIRQLNERGTTVLMIAHDLELVANFAERVVVMDNGQVVQDGPTAAIISKDLAVQCAGQTPERNQDQNSPAPLSPPRGFWSRMDVRTKVIAFLAMVVLACLFQSPSYNMVIGAGIAILTLLAGTSLQHFVRVLAPLVPVFVLIIAVNGISFVPGLTHSDGTALVYVLPGQHLAVVSEGVVRGLIFVLRILLMVLATAFLYTTTQVDEIVQLLHKLRVPPTVAFVVTTSLRFIPALDQRRTQILEAQRARGARLEAKGLIGAIQAYIPIMVPLLVCSIVLANSLAMAMLNRGFGFNRSVTLLRSISFSTRDYLTVGMILIMVSFAVYLRAVLHWGM